jgi:hypothetical protein
MRSLTLLLTCVCVLALVSCSDDVGYQPPVDDTPVSLDNFTNGPDSPGNSGVFRFDDGVLIATTTDPARDLVAYHVFAEDWIGCGGGSGFPLADVQGVETPNGVIHLVGRYYDIPVYIHRLSDVPVGGTQEEFCDFLANDWLYRGTHDLIYTDSDFLGTANAVASYGWRAHGTVFDPAGEQFHYTEAQRALFDTQTFETTWVVENIRVH